MDKNNAIHILSHGQQGYRAGSFMNEVLSVMLGRSPDLLASAYFLWGQADRANRAKLDKVCPGWFEILGQGWRDEITRDEVLARLPDLDLLPDWLHVAFPECTQAIEEAQAELAQAETG